MVGMSLTDLASGITGTVDAVTVQADGSALARINDHWFLVTSLVAERA